MMADTLPHQSVLLHEALDGLNIKPDSLYIDATFGRGGHSRAILEKLGPQGRLIAFDRDPQAIHAAQSIQDARFSIQRTLFALIKGPC